MDSLRDVSVVMCTFNGALFVRQQLESILNQTLRPAEVIVSDDGSSDDTLQIVRSVAEVCDIPIYIHRNRIRLGFSENFLQACDHARCRYVAFSDQDDNWSPRKLEASLDALILAKARLCVHRVETINSTGERLKGPRLWFSRTRVIDPLHSHPWGNFYGFTMLFERSLLDYFPRGSRGCDPHAQGSVLSHDRWVYFLATTFGRLVVLKESLAEYRQHDAQLYGGLVKRSMAERISTKLANGQDQALYLAELAAHRASLLESSLSENNVATYPEPASAGAIWWRTVYLNTKASATLYVCVTRRQRVRLLFENVVGGRYRAFSYGGLGSRQLLQDISVVVLISARSNAGWAPLRRLRGVGRS